MRYLDTCMHHDMWWAPLLHITCKMSAAVQPCALDLLCYNRRSATVSPGSCQGHHQTLPRSLKPLDAGRVITYLYALSPSTHPPHPLAPQLPLLTLVSITSEAVAGQCQVNALWDHAQPCPCSGWEADLACITETWVGGKEGISLHSMHSPSFMVCTASTEAQ